MSLPDEDLWYCKQNGYYRMPESLPDDLVDRLNTATDREIAAMKEPIVWEETDSRAPDDIRRLSKILARDPAYMEAATHPPVPAADTNRLECLCGGCPGVGAAGLS